MANQLTKKQQAILKFIETFTKGNGYGPSYREIMSALGYKSVSTVATHIDSLVSKGYLKKGGSYSARSIELVGMNKSKKDTTIDNLAYYEKKIRQTSPREADKISVVIDILRNN